MSVFAPARLSKLKPPGAALGASVLVGLALLSVAWVDELPRPPKLKPLAGGLGGSSVLLEFAVFSSPPPRLPKLKPPDFGGSADEEGLSGWVTPELPKLKPPGAVDEDARGLEAVSAFSPGFAPNKLPPKRLPDAGGAAPLVADDLLGSEVAVVAVEEEKREGVALFASAAVTGCAAGLAPNEKRPPDAGGAAAGVVLPGGGAALPKRLFPAAGVPGLGSALVTGLLAKRLPVEAGFSAGLAPNRLAVGADALAPDNVVPAALAPNKLPEEEAGGAAAGVVDCPKPPKRDLEAGVVDPIAADAEAPLAKPKV